MPNGHRQRFNRRSPKYDQSHWRQRTWAGPADHHDQDVRPALRDERLRGLAEGNDHGRRRASHGMAIATYLWRSRNSWPLQYNWKKVWDGRDHLLDRLTGERAESDHSGRVAAPARRRVPPSGCTASRVWPLLAR